MAESHSTRLEKLLNLLQDGKSEEIRRAAAEQIASVATNQPSQLFTLLAKITETLLGKRWEGRTAASYCLERIAKHCEHHTVESMRDFLHQSEVKGEDIEQDKACLPSISLDDLNISDLIKQAKPLVASEGAEFSIDSLQDQQTLQQQKKHLKARLGLDGLSGQLVSTDDFIADEDFEMNITSTTVKEDNGSADATCILESRLSAREKAMSKARKRKHGGGNGSAKKAKVDGSEVKENQDINKAGIHMLDDAMSGMWPFQRISDKLCIDLLHPCWETRHGAAMGLRSILRYHSHSAGISANIEDIPTGWLAAEGQGKPVLLSITQADLERAMMDNSTWVEECVVHLLCVLALDRFGDYISDGVIAPVRETAAQVLGTLASSMSDDLFLKTIGLLSEIAHAENWEPRHGAISALKYILIARNTLPQSVFDDILTVARTGLGDHMEDVRSVSAECLIPCVEQFSGGGNEEIQVIIGMLWDALLSLDPINVATKSASRLLECLFMQKIEESALGSVTNIPRLWYHFSSKVPSIRTATIQCYLAIIKSGLAIDSMRFEDHMAGLFSCLQVIVTDTNEDISKLAFNAGHSLLQAMKKSDKFSMDESVLDAVIDVALFVSGRQFHRPSFAILPQIDELVDLEELEVPKYVSKELSSERRFLVCGVAVALANGCTKLENHLFKRVKSLVVSSSGLEKQVGSMALLTDDMSHMNRNEDMEGIVDALFDALNNKQRLEEFTKPYDALAENFAKIGVCNFDFRARTVDDLKTLITKDQKADPKTLLNSYANLKSVEETFVLSVSSLLASAAIQMSNIVGKSLPPKLNNIIQPLIAGIRREKDQFLQGIVAEYLAELVWISRNRNPSPSSKIIKNLCLFASADRSKILDAKKATVEEDSSGQKEESGISSVGVTCRGGISALNKLVSKSRSTESIEQVLPSLWKAQIMEKLNSPGDAASFQPAIDACFILKSISISVNDLNALKNAINFMLPWLNVDNYAIQKSISQTLASICKKSTADFLPMVLEGLDSILKDGSPDPSKFGGITVLSEILNGVGMDVVPYVSLIVVYLMRRMSDHSPSVRSIASQCFAHAVTLMPLAHGVPIPEELSGTQKDMILKDGNFLEQLLNNDNVEDYCLPFNLLTGTLRRYQQEGINWLAFLGRFGLHGVLADDMGLGKTIQSTAIMAAATLDQKALFESSKDHADAPRPSLVVCPATLVSHWPHEISKFVSDDILKPLRVHGKMAERRLCYDSIESQSVVVISYETLRSDIEVISKIKWLYIVLDEGHAIRNPTSKLAQAAHRLNGRHRLILSGTPIQNSIMEIWAMFEFLMPGYLGDRKTFNAKYGKSVEKARRSRKESAQEQESIIALQSLHKQIMPFILRRTKDQVLKDLPPKILQDIMCDPSPLQTMLLQDFNGAGLVESLDSLDSSSDSKSHIFQELSYLRKLCSHPLFVLDKEKKSHQRALQECIGDSDWNEAIKKVANNLEHSPKLAALKELLLDCGIGQEEEEIDAGHRVLVFAQTKAMLNLVESSVLNPMNVSYLRIDGSVDAVERFDVVQKFNADPTIDVMLLTTSVGGLGLNLTSADTVIFMEHDWNPQKDLQAMDRAHRLGQKRSVNVYRLLVKDTLEESIMSLQRFKLDVAAAVVNADNMSMKEMDTGSLLDLFPSEKKDTDMKSKTAKKGLAAILAELPSLEETEAQYAQEFNTDSFRTRLQDGRRESS